MPRYIGPKGPLIASRHGANISKSISTWAKKPGVLPESTVRDVQTRQPASRRSG